MNATLARLEAIVDDAGVAGPLEAVLPRGGRPRQLAVRTLLVGILLSLADGRPGHLVRVHRALLGLGAHDQRRLGVIVDWKRGPHTLTYRQVERTFGLLIDLLAADGGDGTPSDSLASVVDRLLEASIPERHKRASTSIAVDWTDIESWATPPPKGNPGASADADASWGHRNGGPTTTELFYGYYVQAATMVADEHSLPVPELARRLLVTSCHVDPPPAFVAVLERMRHLGIILGDLLSDSGYAHRIAAHWALPVRRLGARLITDLHPSDRGPKGTWAGAVIANGNLYCPRTPPALLELNPLPARATPAGVATHDTATAEAARYKLGRITTNDSDGYHRVQCPAAAGKLRCPLRPDSMTLPLDRPEVLNPPAHPPDCCRHTTTTVPPHVNAKTAQKHDYPGAAWRSSYKRRSAAERTNATIKDPATTDINRGWCRLMGLTAVTLLLTCALVVRNTRTVDAYDARTTTPDQPPTRRRRRHTIQDLIDSG